MDPIVIALVVAVLGPLVTYLIAARQFSGKIDNSDAKELWAESRSIRDWSQERITALEGRVTVLEAGNDELTQENLKLTRHIQELNQTIVALRGEIMNLTTQLRVSRNRVNELERSYQGRNDA